ncbi:class I SAM-dependent methyltransferase [Neorhizobium galegae]|uniref:Methylase involved in ubiquinone/menaquinone biosynthesis n=1 Tax=Neorhizobium galegae bv. orientalis str. HAMBI 540 TaxID=1028800 RepID=A0A068T1A7_NEOGA|nr:class I SAM-dependent methyltransferase [Neorhizobium galegae]CDN51260.1 Methylase involved in ubiquinone/menaquinone biosynthesis [Neorhizobium galegae bv. orientalis str. HAMBI 540]
MKTLSSQDYYFSIVAALKQKNVPPGGEAMMEAILAAIPSGARKIVDFGCNTGWISRRVARAFPQAEVIGVDENPAIIEVAREVARLEDSTAVFSRTETVALPDIISEADVIICGGSAAFFDRPLDLYRMVARCLRSGGLLMDCHYVYDADVPPSLRQEEKEMFGLGWMPDGLNDIVSVHEDAGLSVGKIKRLPRFHFEDSAAARVARHILHMVPKMQELAEAMAKRRRLISKLAHHRYPYLLIARTGEQTVAEGVTQRERTEVPMASDAITSNRHVSARGPTVARRSFWREAARAVSLQSAYP